MHSVKFNILFQNIMATGQFILNTVAVADFILTLAYRSELSTLLINNMMVIWEYKKI